VNLLRGDRLREAREKLGLSHRDLSRACGLGDNMVYRYEHGLNDITAHNLVQIAEKLGVSADYLLGLSDNPTGQLGDGDLNHDERDLVDKFRREGWRGIAHLLGEQLPK